jgi:hypothetical protein
MAAVAIITKGAAQCFAIAPSSNTMADGLRRNHAGAASVS